ncbi:MAG: hypothetical protein AAFP80_15050 [Pseudomonadota bacterium]
MLNRPQFQVIEGGGSPLSDWRNPPKTVIGRSPFERDRMHSYRVASGDASKAVVSGRRQPLLELWWFVFGKLPPIHLPPSITDQAVVEKGHGIGSAKASFRGIKRPVGDDDRGYDYIAFVTNPTAVLEYKPSMSGIASLTAMPRDVVHLTFVKLDFPDGRNYSTIRPELPCNGIVTHWELAECAPKDPTLPLDYKTRFRKRYW